MGEDSLGRQPDDADTSCPDFKLDKAFVQLLHWDAGGGVDSHRASGDVDEAHAGNRYLPSCLGHRSRETASSGVSTMGALLQGRGPEALPASQGTAIVLSTVARHSSNKCAPPIGGHLSSVYLGCRSDETGFTRGEIDLTDESGQKVSDSSHLGRRSKENRPR